MQDHIGDGQSTFGGCLLVNTECYRQHEVNGFQVVVGVSFMLSVKIVLSFFFSAYITSADTVSLSKSYEIRCCEF